MFRSKFVTSRNVKRRIWKASFPDNKNFPSTCMTIYAINETSEIKNQKFILQSFTQGYNHGYSLIWVCHSKSYWLNLSTQSMYCYKVQDLLVYLATDSTALLVRPEIYLIGNPFVTNTRRW